MALTHGTVLWLSKSPPVLYTACWELGVPPGLQNLPIVHFHNPGCEQTGRALQWRYDKLRTMAPAWTHYVISSESRAARAAAHPNIPHLHEHAILNRNRFTPTTLPKIFDAALVAATRRWKRHYLAAKIPRLGVLAHNHAAVSDYAPGALEALLPNATFLAPPGAWQGPKLVTQLYHSSWTSLALSAAEGGCRVVGESLLCGIPVVSTHAAGGRMETAPLEYCRIVEPKQAAVAGAVADLVGHSWKAQDIREAFIDAQQRHRERVEEIAECAIDWEALGHIGAWVEMSKLTQSC